MNAEANEFLFSLGTDASLFGPGHVHLEYYLVFHAADLHIHIERLEGWRPQTGSSRVRRVLDRDAEGLGAEASIFNAGVELSAHASGYNDGSIAIAPADCEVAGESFLNLTGGERVASAHCGSDPAVALSTRPTTWRVAGVLAGVGHDATRMLVIAL